MVPLLKEKKKAEIFFSPREDHANKVFLQAVKEDLKEADESN